MKHSNTVLDRLVKENKKGRWKGIAFSSIVAVLFAFWAYEGTTVLEAGDGKLRKTYYSWWGRQLDSMHEISVSDIAEIRVNLSFGGPRSRGSYYVSIEETNKQRFECIMLDLRMRGGYERACEIRDRIKEALKPGGTPFSIEWPNTFAFRMWLAIVFAAITLLKLLFALRVLKIEDIGKQQNPD